MLKVEQILGSEIARMNEQHLNALRDRVLSDQVTWITGAGISKSAGIPLWSECLLGMWARILLLEKTDSSSSEFHQTINRLKESITIPKQFLEKINSAIKGNSSADILSGINTLEAAEYIKNFVFETLKNNSPQNNTEELCEQAYTTLVKDALTPLGTPDEIFAKLEKGVIGLLAHFFVKQVNANKRIEVINYNFDNLLEFALERTNLVCDDCHIVTSDTRNYTNNKKGVYIYHPHGTVSIVPTTFSADSKSLVLAESSYECLEKRAYLWENSIQAKALQSTSCIFLGFSGEDYNFRRIIKNMETRDEQQHIKHYIFISVESLIKKIFGDEIDKKLLGVQARTEQERETYLNSIKEEDRDKVLKQLLSEQKMVYENMLIIKKLYAQDKYWQHYNIIPIWTTRKELYSMVEYIIN